MKRAASALESTEDLETQNQKTVKFETSNTFTLLFLGSGCSTGVPEIGHVLRRSCQICLEAQQNLGSKNRRNNVSIALIFEVAGKRRCVVVDIGKTFRDACMRHFPHHGVEDIDGIFLTHGHADAMLGMDDLRDVQKFDKVIMSNGDVGARVASEVMPVYMHQATMNVVSKAFDYLMQSPEYYEGTDVLKRRIAMMDFKVIEPAAQVIVSGMPVKCFPVYHGGTYISLGFNFGRPGELVYISDVKVIPEDTWTYLGSISPIQLLVIDVLSPTGIFSHLGLHEALAIVDKLQPMRTLFTGMACSLGDHDQVCAQLAKTHPFVSLAFDGMTVEGLKLDSP